MSLISENRFLFLDTLTRYPTIDLDTTLKERSSNHNRYKGAPKKQTIPNKLLEGAPMIQDVVYFLGKFLNKYKEVKIVGWKALETLARCDAHDFKPRCIELWPYYDPCGKKFEQIAKDDFGISVPAGTTSSVTLAKVTLVAWLNLP